MRRVADVKPGDKVVVIGDGAVGQCAVIATKMRGASPNRPREPSRRQTKMALESGATAVVAERGQEGIAKVRDILGGGADVALECVGTESTPLTRRWFFIMVVGWVLLGFTITTVLLDRPSLKTLRWQGAFCYHLRQANLAESCPGWGH